MSKATKWVDDSKSERSEHFYYIVIQTWLSWLRILFNGSKYDSSGSKYDSNVSKYDSSGLKYDSNGSKCDTNGSKYVSNGSNYDWNMLIND